jgi:hypothetical protein
MVEGDQSVVILDPRIGAGVDQELGQIDVAVKKASMQGGVTRFLKNEKKKDLFLIKSFCVLPTLRILKCCKNIFKGKLLVECQLKSKHNYKCKAEEI